MFCNFVWNKSLIGIQWSYALRVNAICITITIYCEDRELAIYKWHSLLATTSVFLAVCLAACINRLVLVHVPPILLFPLQHVLPILFHGGRGCSSVWLQGCGAGAFGSASGVCLNFLCAESQCHLYHHHHLLRFRSFAIYKWHSLSVASVLTFFRCNS